jgi:predicted PurR-regulated permease PerM
MATSPRDTVGRSPESTLVAGATIAGAVAVLYFGRELFVPLAVALLLSFMLAGPHVWLHRHGVPRLASAISLVTVMLTILAGVGAVVAFQIGELTANLPSYERNLQTKIRDLQGTLFGDGVLQRASTMLNELGKDLTEPAPAASPVLNPAGEVEPVPVTVLPPDPGPFEVARAYLWPLIKPVTTGGIVLVFVIFILLQREDLRDRFIRLAGSKDIQRTTQVMGDAGGRVTRYLLLQLVVNVLYGVPVGVGLWLIGVPNPVLWGLFALVLRFVPYVGPLIAAAFPLALALAVDPGWTSVLLTAGLFIGLELVSNNFIEPWVYGTRTGLSPLAIIAAAIFWAWLWGPVGLLLSTPLTVCLVAFGRHMPRLEFFSVLLGTEQVLTPQQRLYQRLLANDPDEATEQAEEFIKGNSLLAFYEQVGLPMLSIAEGDRASGALDADQRHRVASGAIAVVENLEGEPETAASDGAGANATPPSADTRFVLCAGGRSGLDDAAARMLAQVASRAGASVLPISAELLRSDRAGEVPWNKVEMTCLSYVDTTATAHSRYLVRRLRRRAPRMKVVVGFWNRARERTQPTELASEIRADAVCTTLGQALEQIIAHLHLPPAKAPEEKPDTEVKKPARSAAAE